MNQNDNIDFKPKDEKRIVLSIPVHKVWNALRDWRVRKREDSYVRYEETVQDYQQDQ